MHELDFGGGQREQGVRAAKAFLSQGGHTVDALFFRKMK